MHSKYSNQAEIRREIKRQPGKVHAYLTLISEATEQTSANKGSLRRDIWDFLHNNHKKAVDYRDFLFCVEELLNSGKLKSNQGFFHV
jgi:hypothetical protein